MLGFGSVGQYALGQLSSTSNPSPVVVGVYGAGFVGALTPLTGNIQSVYGTGAVGIIVPSTLQADSNRVLASTLRRLRTLGRGRSN